MHGAEGVVARGTESLTDARERLAKVVSNRNKMAAHIQEIEAIEKRGQNPEERTHYEEDVLPGLKSQLETLESEELQARTRETEGEEHLRTEQAKLDAVHDLLDRLDNSLRGIGPKPVPARAKRPPL